MTSRIQMDDIQYRLEVMKRELTEGGVEDGKILELIADCASLRRSDPEGSLVSALQFIEDMLGMIRRNIATVEELKSQVKKLCG